MKSPLLVRSAARFALVGQVAVSLFAGACAKGPQSSAPAGDSSASLTGVPFKVAFSTQPATAAAGATLAAVGVSILDSGGAVVSSATNAVTLTISAPATLSGTTTAAASGGVATFNGLSVARAGTWRLTASSPGLHPATSASFVISAAAASSLAFSVQPTNSTGGATLSPAPTVVILDAFGNKVPGSGLTVSVALGANSTGATLSGTTSLSAPNGSAAFGSLSVDKVGAGYTLLATAGALPSATSAAFNISTGPVKSLTISSGNGQSGAVGSTLASPLVVVAYDAGKNPVPGFGVSWSALSGGSVSPASTTTNASGFASTSATLGTATGTYLFKAAGTSSPSISTTFSEQAQPGPAAALSLSAPTAASAGQAFTATATVLDSFGNRVTTSIAQVTLSASAGFTLGGTTTVAAKSGVATFHVSICGTGGATLTASSSGLASGSASVSVSGGTPASLVRVGNGQSAVVGSTLTIGVRVLDGCGDPLPAVAVAWSGGPGTLSAATSSTDSTGTASVQVTLSTVAGSEAFTATVGALTAHFTLLGLPGPARSLAFVQQPGNVTAGNAFSPAVSVALRDQYGNAVTTSGTSIAIAVTGIPSGTLQGTDPVNTLGGLATFNGLAPTFAGSFTLTASATGLTSATSNSFTVGPAAPSQMLTDPTLPTSGTVGTAVQLDVIIEDQFGNAVPGASVSWTASASGLVDGGATSTVTTDSAGAATTQATLCTTAGACTFGAALGALSATYVITATPGAPAALVFGSLPSPIYSATTISPAVQVSIVDAYANVEPDNTTVISLSLWSTQLAGDQSASLQGTRNQMAAAGVASFYDLRIAPVGIPYYFVANAPGLSDASPGFVVQCSAGFACGSSCVDLSSNVNDCGACGNVCATSAPNTVATCTAGACGVQCAAGTDQCTGNPADGCQSLSTAQNCGACGYDCGVGGVCSSGACVGGTRTVHAQMRTQFTDDTGAVTVVNGWPTEMSRATVTALLAPDGSPSGYTTFAVTPAVDGSFSVPLVPRGDYFIQIDTPGFAGPNGNIPVTNRALYQVSADAPDLTAYLHGRPGRLTASLYTPVTLALNGLLPLDVPRSQRRQIVLTSPQAGIYGSRPVPLLATFPPIGATSINGTIDWSQLQGNTPFSFMPDAAQGDVTVISQRLTVPVGSGANAGTLRTPLKYATLNNFVVQDGQPSTLAANFIDTPQTGSTPTDMRLSQFVPLASGFHPTAQPTAPANSITGCGWFATQSDIPNFGQVAQGTFFETIPTVTQDLNYGTVSYGQVFTGNGWHDIAQCIYQYDITLPAPAGQSPLAIQDTYFRLQALPAGINPFAPIVGSPAAPMINGSDAFPARVGVGSQPVISWTAPTLGTPTQYGVSLSVATGLQPNDINTLGITLYAGTSVKIPAGILQAGRTYQGQISATISPHNIGSPVLNNETPVDNANVDFGLFAPDVPAAFAVGGTVTGLSSSIVLANGSEQLTVSSNGAFAFATKVSGAYSVSIATQPSSPAQTCTLTNASGTATADVTNVVVSCPPFVVAGGLLGPGTVETTGGNLYFATSSPVSCYGTGTPRDSIFVVPVSGGTPTAIAPIDHYAGNCGAYGLVFDSTYVYWADYADATIWRATLAGAGATQLLNNGQYMNALAIDPVGGYLFFHQYGYASIGRFTVTGTNGNLDWANADDINGQNLATDASNLYWTDQPAGTVNKVPFSATPPATPTRIATGESSPFAPFVAGSTLYWLASGNLRQSPVVSPSASSLATGLPSPNSVVVDASSAWVLASGASASDGRLYKIPLGGGAPVIVAQGLYQPNSLAMDAGHLYWANNNTSGNVDGTITMIVK